MIYALEKYFIDISAYKLLQILTLLTDTINNGENNNYRRLRTDRN